MPGLVEILQKRSARIEDDLPRSIMDPIRNGEVPPESIGLALENVATGAVTNAVKRRLIYAKQAPELQQHLHAHLKRYQKPLEAEAYRATASVYAPVTPGEIATSAAGGIGFPMLISRLPRIGGTPLSVGSAAKWWVGPQGLIPAAVFGAGFSALRPFSDPLYQRGQRGYIESFSENIKGEAQNLARKGEEARRKYGPLLGIPLQAVHGIMNPIASLAYGAGSLRDLMMGKTGEDLSLKAERALSSVLRK